MIALLLAAAVPSTAVNAERAFARDAQALGQWTAFAKWADRDAVMFTPQAVWARDFLKGRKNPPQSVRWWPERAISSCDGHTTVTAGPWRIPSSNATGGFTTVWQLDKQNWRWVYDAGDQSYKSGKPPARIRSERASCRGKAPGAPVPPPPALTAKQANSTPADYGRGNSADKTLGWDWKVKPDGTRLFRTYLWNGTRYRLVLNQTVAPQK
ncbi:MAG: hypothetical protein ABIO43_13200 [Sphingomicrobium sp.]